MITFQHFLILGWARLNPSVRDRYLSWRKHSFKIHGKWLWKNEEVYYRWEREIALVFAHQLFFLLCLCLSHLHLALARSWVQRAEALSDSVVCFPWENPVSIIFFCDDLKSFPTPRHPSWVIIFCFHCAPMFLSSNLAEVFDSSVWVVRCENTACKPSLCLHYILVQELFCFVSGLLVALSIMSGDLKNYVENVSLFIRMTSFLGWGTLLF